MPAPSFGAPASNPTQFEVEIGAILAGTASPSTLAAALAALGGVPVAAHPQVLAAGETTFDRRLANSSTLGVGVSGRLHLTYFTGAFTASFTKTAGTTYAVGIIVVSGAAIPTFQCNQTQGGAGLSMFNTAPRLQARLASQTDLPATITNASLALDGTGIYAEVTP
jgi:hypothetical protein